VVEFERFDEARGDARFLCGLVDGPSLAYARFLENFADARHVCPQ
jgi:hypothetical protein